MADPMTLAMISMGGNAAGGAVSAVGALFSGQASSAAYKYQAGVAAVNEKIAKQNAVYSREVGEFKAEQSGMKSRQQAGAIKVAQAASGFRGDMGSAKAVGESQHMIAESEQDVIRSNAAKAAYGHEVEAINFASQKELYNMARKNAKTESYFKAASSILGSASSTADKWLQYGSNFGAA